MSEENKTAEMVVKNIPETIHLILTDEKEFNEDDEVMDFEKDFDHEYTYWAQGESNSGSDINYVLKSKYDQQQSANAELKQKLQQANFATSILIDCKEEADFLNKIIELKKQNEELVEALNKLLPFSEYEYNLQLSNGCKSHSLSENGKAISFAKHVLQNTPPKN